ncbi:hypothetical protein D3C79_693100 [compost metagenome]
MVFINGRHVVLTGLRQILMGAMHVEVRTIEDFNEVKMHYGATSMVRESDLQRLCTEAFPLGTPIYSTLGNFENALTGKVVGHELLTNRVIVVSDKVEKYKEQRTRYSYGIDELAVYVEESFAIIPNHKYVVNFSEPMIAIQDIFNPDTVMLVHSMGLSTPIMNVPMQATMKTYTKHGIHTIRPLQEAK